MPKSSNSEKTVSRVLRDTFGPSLVENRELKDLTTIGLGGVADYLVDCQTTDHIIQAVKIANEFKLAYEVIAGGSGILVSDVGIPGLVILNRTKRIAFEDSKSQVVVEGGLTNSELITTSAARDLGGVEFLARVPGTIGGAVWTNASWHNFQIGSFVREVSVLVARNGEEPAIVTLKPEELGFKPFLTKFLHHKLVHGEELVQQSWPIILTVRLQLTKLPQDEIRRRLRLIHRQNNQQVSRQAGLGYYLNQSLAEVSIDFRELARLNINGARISRNNPDIVEKHPTKTRSDDVRSLISQINEIVSEKTNHSLDTRVSYLGYWPNWHETSSSHKPADA